MDNISEELKVLIPLVKEVGKEIMKIYESNFDHEIKHDNSPVTKADLLSEKLLLEGLKQFDYGIVSEEMGNKNLEKDKIWIIDPLDGTKDFIHKTGEFSIMVGLLNKGIPELGIIYAPAIKKLYYAQKGFGAYLQEKDNKPIKLKVNSISNLSKFTMVRSRNHFREQEKKFCETININKFELLGSVGIKFGAIAEGRAEICTYFTSKMGVWDDLPSQVLLEEAGGEVFDIDGNKPYYDIIGRKMKRGFIGTNGTNKEKIIETIKKLNY